MLRPFILTTALFVSSIASATEICAIVFKNKTAPFVHRDPIEQMITWEQTSNTLRWTKDQNTVALSVVKVPREEVLIRAGDDTPHELLNYFARAKVKWPRHPYNANSLVPHSKAIAAETMPARFSASRSMFLREPGLKGFYSIKMPTSHPHRSTIQASKADLKNSVIISRNRSEMISEIDKKIGSDPKFEVLTDKLSIADVRTGNGIVIRDLTPLTDGYYYLPAFSVPYAGREIAKHLGANFDTLWREFWAKSLGESKAKLLLRYGLEMKTPNAQNMLIQLNKSLVPTGKMVFRDISDSSLVGPIAIGLKLEEYVQSDTASGYTVFRKLFANWENSVWQMDEGGINPNTSLEWGIAHDQAYRSTIINELSRTDAGTKIFDEKLIEAESDIFDALESHEGQIALNEYRQLLEAEAQKLTGSQR